MITQSTFIFLKDLAENNNREWFTENRKRYEAAKKEVEKLVGALLKGVNEFEPLPNTEVKDCIFRINRDIRFSKQLVLVTLSISRCWMMHWRSHQRTYLNVIWKAFHWTRQTLYCELSI